VAVVGALVERVRRVDAIRVRLPHRARASAGSRETLG
jgi:hypothetical protein